MLSLSPFRRVLSFCRDGEHVIHRSAWRNCLENSWTGLDRVFLVSQSRDKGALQPVFPTHRTSEWSPFGFSKQFRKGYSAKFGYRILHSHGPIGSKSPHSPTPKH